jgi:hypothetical protein
MTTRLDVISAIAKAKLAIEAAYDSGSDEDVARAVQFAEQADAENIRGRFDEVLSGFRL